jgi:hypothetical protein
LLHCYQRPSHGCTRRSAETCTQHQIASHNFKWKPMKIKCTCVLQFESDISRRLQGCWGRKGSRHRPRHSHGHGDIRSQKQMEGPSLSTCSHFLCPLSSQPRSLRKHFTRRGSSISHGMYYPHGIQFVSTNRGLTHGTY